MFGIIGGMKKLGEYSTYARELTAKVEERGENGETCQERFAIDFCRRRSCAYIDELGKTGMHEKLVELASMFSSSYSEAIVGVDVEALNDIELLDKVVKYCNEAKQFVDMVDEDKVHKDKYAKYSLCYLLETVSILASRLSADILFGEGNQEIFEEPIDKGIAIIESFEKFKNKDFKDIYIICRDKLPVVGERCIEISKALI